MSTEEKSICIIEFLDKKTYWRSWSKKFLSCGKRKDYKKLLVRKVDKTPTQEEYKTALKGQTDLNKNCSAGKFE